MISKWSKKFHRSSRQSSVGEEQTAQEGESSMGVSASNARSEDLQEEIESFGLLEWVTGHNSAVE